MRATPISLSALNPPMPGPWPARGSTMTNGRLFCVDLDAFGRHDAHQRIVHGPRQLAAVHDELAAELEHMRRGLCGVLVIALAALLQDIEEEHPALAGIDPISPCIASEIGCTLRDGCIGARQISHSSFPTKA